MQWAAGNCNNSVDILQVGVGFVVMGALGYVVKLSMWRAFPPFTLVAFVPAYRTDS